MEIHTIMAPANIRQTPRTLNRFISISFAGERRTKQYRVAIRASNREIPIPEIPGFSGWGKSRISGFLIFNPGIFGIPIFFISCIIFTFFFNNLYKYLFVGVFFDTKKKFLKHPVCSKINETYQNKNYVTFYLRKQ